MKARSKKILKIGGISLLSLLGLLIIGICAVLYIVFTPARLTPIVRQIAEKYVEAEVQIGTVEPTLFSTFPYLGVEISDIAVINPADGAESDTVAGIRHIVASIDIKGLLFGNDLIIEQIKADDIRACLYVDSLGVSNFDIINPQDDEEDEDSTPFDRIEVRNVILDGSHLCYTNRQSDIEALLRQVHLGVDFGMTQESGDGHVNITAEHVAGHYATDTITIMDLTAGVDLGSLNLTDGKGSGKFQVGSRELDAHIAGFDIAADQLQAVIDISALDMQTRHAKGYIGINTPALSVADSSMQYLQQRRLNIELPIQLLLDRIRLQTEPEAKVSLDRHEARLNGWVQMDPNQDDIEMDLNVHLNQWHVDSLLAVIPDSLIPALAEMTVCGVLDLSAHAFGTYNDTLMPQIDACATLTDGSFSHTSIPFFVHDITADLSAHVDLNEQSLSALQINNLQATTRQSHIQATGNVSPLLDRQTVDLKVNAGLHLPDFQYFLDDKTTIEGEANGQIKLYGRLDDIASSDYEHLTVDGSVNIDKLKLQTDSMLVETSRVYAGLQVPNKHKSNGSTRFARIALDADNLHLLNGTSMEVQSPSASVQANLSNILSQQRYWDVTADLDLSHLRLQYEDIKATLNHPQGSLTARLDQSDTDAVPEVRLQLNTQQLSASMDTIDVSLKQAEVNVAMDGVKQNRSLVNADIRLKTMQFDGQMGRMAQLQSQQLDLQALVTEDPSQTDDLLHWNPRVDLTLRQGKALIDGFAAEVGIPNISLNYNNQLFDIKKSEFVIGNSDFHLSGTLEDVGEYIAHEGFLSGDLTFTSDMTDVNELMDLFSGVGADSAMQADMLAAADKDESEGNPFIVPQNMNIALHTNIRNARIGRELAYNLGGNVYLQDGTVILEEIGFICQAAKLQLTGIYRTPRRNHIYLGADIHLLDIHIAEMLRMFPDVDTMLPMLSTFSGNAEFHMAVETYMNAKYELKPSTTIGALSIRGDSLELLDNQTFSKIARLLLFKRRGKMVADSISAEITLWNKEIDIYPFLIAINNYRAAVGGRHNLDMTYDYHVSLLRPLRLGVNARTKKGKLKIGLARCKYAKDFSPTRKNVVESQNMTLRDEIRRALKRTIKTE